MQQERKIEGHETTLMQLMQSLAEANRLIGEQNTATAQAAEHRAGAEAAALRAQTYTQPIQTLMAKRDELFAALEIKPGSAGFRTDYDRGVYTWVEPDQKPAAPQGETARGHRKNKKAPPMRPVPNPENTGPR